MICKKCGEDKLESEYRKHERWGKIYTDKSCRKCINKQNEEWKKANPEKALSYRKTTWKRMKESGKTETEEFKAAKSKVQKKYYDGNREEIQAKLSAYNKTPVGRAKRTVQRRARRSNPEYKQKEYGLQNKRVKKRVFKKLVNTSNSNVRKHWTCEHQLTAFEIWKIAKKQRLICPLTGKKLTPTDISLDHITPLSKGGTNKPDNIRLVSKWVNLMRLNHSDEELFSICRMIVAHQDSKAPK